MKESAPKQRTTEWLDVTRLGPADYHRRQFETPYRSTVAFVDFLKRRVPGEPRSIIDLGCGEGANALYLAQSFTSTEVIGVDLNPDVVAWGNEMLVEVGATRCRLEVGDLYDLDECHRNVHDGVVSLQTLSWLPEFAPALRSLAALNTDWIAMSSLFYDGPVNTKIEIQDYTQPLGGKPYREAYYNVYALPLVRELLQELGFVRIDATPFEIDIDLPRPHEPGMGTYTEQLAGGRRLQISGPLLMNWQFVFASRA